MKNSNGHRMLFFRRFFTYKCSIRLAAQGFTIASRKRDKFICPELVHFF